MNEPRRNEKRVKWLFCAKIEKETWKSLKAEKRQILAKSDGVVEMFEDLGYIIIKYRRPKDRAGAFRNIKIPYVGYTEEIERDE